ncbi:nucleotide sugar dehydrogenase [Desulfitobacterium sp. LBE]|uniref:UDP binding domain-containing protein n=1 Tax=Desulfitobacterium TaxID=36853 RepID=UPI000369A4EB|nr:MULTISPECIES: UDP binding domain-containing protein [Desulfitobacterium]TWH58194.1 nucleotide sugar dehydrogenase [Desulfitobacterium sp. LBE]
MKIAVVGLGNIGFNLFSYINKKYPNSVVGVDIDAGRVNDLRSQGYRVTTDYRALTGIDIWLLAPSTGDQGENLFAALGEMIICPGALISIESTLPPGTMELVRKYLEGKGYRCGQDVYLIHVPHRVMFGVDETVCDTPRVMGAFTQACRDKGRQFYEPLVPQLVEVEDVRIAELSKVVENVKRYVDVAFAQELYQYCKDQGMDFAELRKAVNSKSNVELLGTDWGIGGECLPKDMRFLRKVCPSPLLEGAAIADQEYRDRILQQVGTHQNVLIKGLSYKAGVKDLKHSRGVDLVRALEEAGNTVWVVDPLFTPEELEASGFKTVEKFDEADLQGWIVLEREKALK